MRDIILRHNRLNGVIFSVVEFGLIGLFVGAFAAYYLLHRRAVMAIVSSGIALNCLPVVVYGLRQWAEDRAVGRRRGSFWDPAAREELKRENPHMLRDTLILTAGTLLPFVTVTAALVGRSEQSEL